jgi:carboxylesterase type B
MDGCPNDVNYAGNPTCDLSYRVYTRMNNIFTHYKRANSKGPRGFTDQLYKQWLQVNYGAASIPGLLSAYPGPNDKSAPASQRYGTNYWAAEYLMGDFIMYCTGRRAAEFISRQMRLPWETNGRVYQYYFKRTPKLAPFRNHQHPKTQYIDDGFGACHGCEIPFVFLRTDSKEYGIDGAGEVALGRAMSTYWTNFAYNSDPNNSTGRLHPEVLPPQLPRWGQYEVSSDAAVVLDANDQEALIQTMSPHPRAHGCSRFWGGYFEHQGWFSNGTNITYDT